MKPETVIKGYYGGLWHYESKESGVALCGRNIKVCARWLAETLEREMPDAPFCDLCKSKADVTQTSK